MLSHFAWLKKGKEVQCPISARGLYNGQTKCRVINRLEADFWSSFPVGRGLGVERPMDYRMCTALSTEVSQLKVNYGRIGFL